MLLIRAADLERSCRMADAIEAVAQGFRALSERRAVVPLRTAVPLQHDGTLLTMPAGLAGSPYYCVKVVAVAPGALEHGLPFVSASVLLGDSATGAVLAALDGTSLTALRTGAAGGVAARVLARHDASRCAIFGAGAQARTQLLAAAVARRLVDVRVVTRRREHADAFVAWASARPELASTTIRVSAPDEAVRGADLVITATNSATPVLRGALLAPGVHVTAIGSYTPAMRELDADAMRGARVVVDERNAALHEAGELAGLGPQDLVEIGEIVAGTADGRRVPGERTVFKSVGNAVQDLAVAALAYERCRMFGYGEEVRWP